MTKTERRRRDGYSVKDYERCNRSLGNAFVVIRNRLDMFLEEHPMYREGSRYFFCEGCSSKTPPRIVVEFRKSGGDTVFRSEDRAKILTFMYQLTSWRENFKFETRGSGAYVLEFLITFRNHRPFTDSQCELDVFGRFGGNASPPDPDRYYFGQKFPWQPPQYPRKNGQCVLDLGTFLCGSGLPRWSDISPPNVIFSNLDPGEVDDLRFDYPPLPEKTWQQLEFVLVPRTPQVSPPVSGNILLKFSTRPWK